MKLKGYLILTIPILCLVIISLIFFLGTKKPEIRDTITAGIAYSSESTILKKTINEYFNQADINEMHNVRCLIVPHAAYDYSGLIAAYGYKALSDHYNKVIILSPSHRIDFEGVSVPDVEYYKTPLGLVRIDPSIDNLKKEEFFTGPPDAHQSEHAIEVQLPFLQEVLSNFTLIPLIIGRADPAKIANILTDYIDKNTLIIVSSDLSHNHDYESAINLDKNCIDSITNLDFEKTKTCEACGITPILTVMEIAKQKKWAGQLLNYKNSGDTKGEKNNVFGYMSFVFLETHLDKTQQNGLLKIARQTIEEYMLEDSTIELETMQKEMSELGSAYVTLKKEDKTIACMGRVIPSEPLQLSVKTAALEIAKNNPGFEPLKKSDIGNFKIEISVLSPYHKIQFRDLNDLLNKIHEGEDGLLISETSNKATILPKFWNEFSDKKHFLTSLCNKAGLSDDCWNEGITFYKYTAQEFQEE